MRKALFLIDWGTTALERGHMNLTEQEPQPTHVYRIPLTQGQYALVDEEDYERINQFKWYARWDPHTKSYYAERYSTGGPHKQRKTIRMHREIAGTPEGMKTDHRNHDTLDNRKDNLRNCDSRQNAWNQRKRVNNTSGFKGVSWSTAAKKWKAEAPTREGRKYLGVFETKELAREACVNFAREHHGEFFCD